MSVLSRRGAVTPVTQRPISGRVQQQSTEQAYGGFPQGTLVLSNPKLSVTLSIAVVFLEVGAVFSPE